MKIAASIVLKLGLLIGSAFVGTAIGQVGYALFNGATPTLDHFNPRNTLAGLGLGALFPGVNGILLSTIGVSIAYVSVPRYPGWFCILPLICFSLLSFGILAGFRTPQLPQNPQLLCFAYFVICIIFGVLWMRLRVRS